MPSLRDKPEVAAGSTSFDAGSDDGDNSVGFWQIQALKACKHTGLWEKEDFRQEQLETHLITLRTCKEVTEAIGYRRVPQEVQG